MSNVERISLIMGVIITIELLAILIIGAINTDFKGDLEEFLITKYDLPMNLEENHIYYDWYYIGDHVKYTVYRNTVEEGIVVLYEGVWR